MNLQPQLQHIPVYQSGRERTVIHSVGIDTYNTVQTCYTRRIPTWDPVDKMPAQLIKLEMAAVDSLSVLQS